MLIKFIRKIRVEIDRAKRQVWAIEDIFVNH